MAFDPRDVTTFDQIRDEVRQFERILNRFGIQIGPGTALESMCLTLNDLERGQDRENWPGLMEDLRPATRAAYGLRDLVCRINRLGNHPDFPVLLEHLKLLNSGAVAQNISAPTDQFSAKIFELLFALICLEVGDNLKVDGPVRSYGDNPDIVVNLAGKRWGFACKVTGGSSPKTLFDRLKDGIEQIEKTTGTEIGCVVFNMKNQIDHDQTWPMENPQQFAAGREAPTYVAWRDPRYPLGMLRDVARRWQKALFEAHGAENLRRLFVGKKSTPGLLFFLQTTILLRRSDDEPVVNSTLGHFCVLDLGMSDADFAVLASLNEPLHHFGGLSID